MMTRAGDSDFCRSQIMQEKLHHPARGWAAFRAPTQLPLVLSVSLTHTLRLCYGSLVRRCSALERKKGSTMDSRDEISLTGYQALAEFRWGKRCCTGSRLPIAPSCNRPVRRSLRRLRCCYARTAVESCDLVVCMLGPAHCFERRGIMPIDIELLHQIPLFAPLNREDLAHVAAMTVERHYERGDLILLEGDMGGALHYVRRGLVKVFKTSAGGKEQVLRLIAAGHTFNDVPALDGGPNPASAAAMEPSIVYVIHRAELRQLISTRPEVAAAVVQTLAGALRHLVALVEDLSLRHTTARVAKILLEQEASSQEDRQSHHLTQQEMA